MNPPKDIKGIRISLGFWRTWQVFAEEVTPSEVRALLATPGVFATPTAAGPVFWYRPLRLGQVGCDKPRGVQN